MDPRRRRSHSRSPPPSPTSPILICSPVIPVHDSPHTNSGAPPPVETPVSTRNNPTAYTTPILYRQINIRGHSFDIPSTISDRDFHVVRAMVVAAYNQLLGGNRSDRITSLLFPGGQVPVSRFEASRGHEGIGMKDYESSDDDDEVS